MKVPRNPVCIYLDRITLYLALHNGSEIPRNFDDNIGKVKEFVRGCLNVSLYRFLPALGQCCTKWNKEALETERNPFSILDGGISRSSLKEEDTLYGYPVDRIFSRTLEIRRPSVHIDFNNGQAFPVECPKDRTLGEIPAICL